MTKRLLFLALAVFSFSARAQTKKVMLIVLENETFDKAVAQPYLADFAKRGALLKNYHGVGHPAQPNYVALVAGDTLKVHNDHVSPIEGKTIADLLEAHGKTWKVYAEDFPGECSLVGRAKQYARKHNPLISFKSIHDSPERCAHIVNASAFPQDMANKRLPDFSMYIPNQLNSGHDSDVKTASQWLSRFLPPVLKDPEMKDTLVIIVFDENDYSSKDNQVYEALAGKGVNPGSVSTDRYDHYNMLRTIEDFLGLESLEKKDAKAKPITGIWREDDPPAKAL
jgi:acid phosphatase